MYSTVLICKNEYKNICYSSPPPVPFGLMPPVSVLWDDETY